tara:strand:- start:370 stop:543 length:174 start_codon:yes stop_codon:yes gene_type:complete
MKKKECRYCKKIITKENAIIVGGYLTPACRPCKRIEARKYAAKKRKLKKGTFWETDY